MQEVTPERWRQAQELFELACLQPPENLDSFLRKTRPDDPDLCHYVKRLVLRDVETSALDSGVLVDVVDLSDLLAGDGPLVEGNRLANRFRLLRRLDEGGMGQVWEAEDEQADKRVALKAVQPGKAGAHLTGLLREEVNRAQEVNHPNVCRVNEFFVDSSGEEPVAFLTMKLLTGRTLEEALRQQEKGLDARDAQRILAECAAALDAIHEAGIVHCDFKPRNVILTADSVDAPGRAVVIDFGISRALRGREGGPRVAGTPAYMAPEQHRADAEPTAAADIYSFAKVACRIWTGKLPEEGGLAALPWNWKEPIERALHPHAEERPERASEILRSAKGRRRFVIGAGAAAVGAIAAAKPVIGLIGESRPSLAVLRFESGPEGIEFAEGFSQDLVRALRPISSLRIVPWAASGRIPANGGPALASTAQSLDCRYLLLGSIRQQGETLSVTAQIIEAKRNAQVWIQRFEKPASAIGQIHQEIAQAVPAQLGLPPASVPPPVSSENAAAHQAYLYGKYHLSQRRVDSLPRAERCFNEAIRLDSDMAPAHSALAETLLAMAESRLVPPKEGVARAQASARRSLDLDPRSPEAFAVIGLSSAMYDHNYTLSDLNFNRALALDPNHVLTLRWRAYVACALGQFDRAESSYRRALDVDPLSLPVQRSLAGLYFYSRQGSKLRQQCERVVELEPGFLYHHSFLAYSAYFEGRTADAARSARLALDTARAEPASVRLAAEVLGLIGQGDEAKAAFDSLAAEREKNANIPATYLGYLAAALQAPDLAFSWLEKAWSDSDPYLTFVAIYPATDRLRSDPRYASLIHRLNLTPAKAADSGSPAG